MHCCVTLCAWHPQHPAHGALESPAGKDVYGSSGHSVGHTSPTEKQTSAKQETGQPDASPSHHQLLVPGLYRPDRLSGIFSRNSLQSNGELSNKDNPKDEDGKTSSRGLCFPPSLFSSTRPIGAVTTLSLSALHSVFCRHAHSFVFFFLTAWRYNSHTMQFIHLINRIMIFRIFIELCSHYHNQF